MALTSQQDIPIKSETQKEPWTIKRLFPFTSSVAALTKTFVNPFDILLGFMVFVVGLGELLGIRISGMFWLFMVLILGMCAIERVPDPQDDETV